MSDEENRAFSITQARERAACAQRKPCAARVFVTGAIFATAWVMRSSRPTPAALRAEAKLLTIAGLILLGVGFPATLILAAQALSPEGLSPVLPIAVGTPPIILGYLACHFASQRMVKAKALEAPRR